MANLALSVDPGYYLAAQNASWILDPNVDFVSFTKDGPSPAISKYIAYDTLVPPNPFIAVTQDGNGNVVYDGGFPKFYNSVAPEAGLDPLFSMEYRGTRTAGATGNTYYYDAFTDLQVTIAAGDRLVYDIWQNSVDARVGIDAITTVDVGVDPTHYSLRDWATPLADQNGLGIHPATPLGGLSVNQWYHREFDLTPCAGYRFVKWSLAYEGEIAGTFYTRFKEVYIVDSTGKVKAVLFKDTIRLPNSTSTEAGASGYTGTSKEIYDPRSHLSASFKYLFNAIRWTANPAKVAAGNKKILILGDVVSTGSYAIKNTGATGFFTSLTNLCTAVGFTPTFKDTSDYVGGYLNVTLAEMSDYACILVMGSLGGWDAKITDACVTDMQTFRINGGGIILITDDGPDLNNVTEAYPAPQVARQFFVTVNKIAVNFGAYFTGNYDRTPVNVGYLRANYGDHPLYSGMLDSESINAGGSESKVVLATFQKYTAANIPNVSIANNGINSIKAIAMMKDGTVELYSFVYIIATGQLLKILDADGVEINSLPTSFRNTRTFSVQVLGAGLGTIVGEVLLNADKVAELSYSDALGSVESWYGGGSQLIPVAKGDVFTIRITSPFQYSRTLPVNRNQPGLGPAYKLPVLLKSIQADGLSGVHVNTVLKNAIAQMNLDYSHLQNYLHGDPATNLKVLRQYFASTLELPPTKGYIYPSSAAAIEAMSRLVPPSQETVFNTWSRFSNNAYFPGGVGATGEAAAWTWDAAKQAAVMPLNSNTWLGFVSPDVTDTYEIDAVIQSDDLDDDTNGIILSFALSPDGLTNSRLCLQVNRGGNSPQASHSVAVNGSSVAIVSTDFAGRQPTPNGGDGWAGRFTRVKINRNGDNFKIQASQWNSMLLDPASLMQFTLNDKPELAQFKGAKPWGFINISQAKSYFKLNSFKGGQLYDIVIDVATGRVYRYSNGGWAVLQNLAAKNIFGAPRTIVNSETGAQFHLNADGSITAL
jgi:hypothetical protein